MAVARLTGPTFADWVAARGPALTRLAFLLCGDAAVARRLVERVLVPVGQRWSEVRDRAELDAEVQRLVIEGAERHLRGTPTPGQTPPWLAGTRDPLTSDAQRLWAAYTELDVATRAALVLRAGSALPEDIAEILDWTTDTVRETLTVAYDRLGAAFADRRTPPDVEPLARDMFDRYAQLCAPESAELAGRVERRCRTRRRRQTAAGAVLAGALLVPLAWVAAPPESPESAAGSAPGIPLAEVPEWRWEAYGGVQVQVPASWGYGDLTRWCDDQPSAERVVGPAVDRPSLGRPAREREPVCSISSGTGNRGLERPTYTAGLLLRPRHDPARLSRADVAPGADIYSRRIGEVEITVVDLRAELARRILASATIVEGTDEYGCAPTARVPRMGRYLSLRQAPVDSLLDVHAVSVCRYQVGKWTEPTLYRSRRLLGGVADEALRRVQDAPSMPRPTGPDGCAEPDAVLLRFWAGSQPTNVWMQHAECDAQGLDDGERLRELPSHVLALALG